MKWMESSPQDERLIGEAETRLRGRKKKTNRWCKGKVGVAHTPEIVLGQHLPTKGCSESGWYDRDTSEWRASGRWVCWHIKVCSTCGKHLETVVDCPDNGRGVPPAIRRR